MKKFAWALVGLSVFALLGVTTVQVTVSQADIDAENGYYQSLGITLPPGGIVLSQPFTPPYTSRSFVVPNAWLDRFDVLTARKAYTVDAADVRADLPTLQMVLSEVYSGYHTAAARGWDWDGWFRSWDSDLARYGDAQIAPAVAFAPWAQLEDFQLDNHSAPRMMGFTSGSVSGQLLSRPIGSCSQLNSADGRTFALSVDDAGQQPHAVRSWDGTRLAPAWYVSFPSRDGGATSITCGNRAIAVHMASQPAVAVVPPYFLDYGDGIGYLRAPGIFSYGSNDAFRKALDTAPRLGKLKVLLLDLRGNRGGDAPLDVLAHWFSADELKHATFETQYGTSSCLTTALWFNLGQVFLTRGLKPPITPQTHGLLQRLVDAVGSAPAAGCSIKPTVTTVGVLSSRPFTVERTNLHRTRIVAIVDNGCGSDCDGLAVLLSRLPDTVLVGTSTYGVFGFTQPGTLVLPHSRIPVDISLSRTDSYGDGRSVDGYGVAVDVLLPTARAQDMGSLVALARVLEK